MSYMDLFYHVGVAWVPQSWIYGTSNGSDYSAVIIVE